MGLLVEASLSIAFFYCWSISNESLQEFEMCSRLNEVDSWLIITLVGVKCELWSNIIRMKWLSCLCSFNFSTANDFLYNSSQFVWFLNIPNTLMRSPLKPLRFVLYKDFLSALAGSRFHTSFLAFSAEYLLRQDL